jgi:hypothetical protein
MDARPVLLRLIRWYGLGTSCLVAMGVGCPTHSVFGGRAPVTSASKVKTTREVHRHGRPDQVSFDFFGRSAQ